MKMVFLSMFCMLTIIPVSGQTVWQLDKAHSSIGFEVTHMVVTDVPGKFTAFEGTVTTAGNDFTTMKVEFTIDANSITTENERRDAHLRGADFFDVNTYPTLTFKSTNVERKGEKEFKITGDLTMHGKTNPVTLDAKLRGPVESMDKTRVGFKATTSLDRYDYDLKWNKVLETGGVLVDKEVDIVINIELIKE